VITALDLALPTASVNVMVSLVAVLASSLIAVVLAVAMVPMIPVLVVHPTTSTSQAVAAVTVWWSEDDEVQNWEGGREEGKEKHKRAAHSFWLLPCCKFLPRVMLA